MDSQPAGGGRILVVGAGDLIRRARVLGTATPLLDLTTLALRVHEHRLAGA